MPFGFGVELAATAALFARDLDRQQRGVLAFGCYGVLDDFRRRDGILAHARRVVTVRVGDQHMVLHEVQHLVPVPLRTVRNDLVDTGIHLRAVAVEKFFQRPRGYGENVEQDAKNGYLTEMRRETVSRCESERLRDILVPHEFGGNVLFDLFNCPCHQLTTKSTSIPIYPIPP